MPDSDTAQQFREMMERFECVPERTNGAATSIPMRGMYEAALKTFRAMAIPSELLSAGPRLTDAERFYRIHGCSPRAYLDRAEGLVPLKQKPEPQREVPAITADAYAALKRFS